MKSIIKKQLKKKLSNRNTTVHMKKIIRKELKNRNNKRGSRTRGWIISSPKRGKQRHSLKKRHPNCFLIPSKEKFPICDMNGKVDCRGITSAKIRASQWPQYHYLLNKISSLEKRYNCRKK